MNQLKSKSPFLLSGIALTGLALLFFRAGTDRVEQSNLEKVFDQRKTAEPLTLALEKFASHSLVGQDLKYLKAVIESPTSLFPEYLEALERTIPQDFRYAIGRAQEKLERLGSNEASKKTMLLTAFFRVGPKHAEVSQFALAEMSDGPTAQSIEDPQERNGYLARAHHLFLETAVSPQEALKGTLQALQTLDESSVRPLYVSGLLLKHPDARDVLLEESRGRGLNLELLISRTHIPMRSGSGVIMTHDSKNLRMGQVPSQ